MNQQLDTRLREAFDEIVRHAPDIGAAPTDQMLAVSLTSTTGRGRVGTQAWVASAAAAVVVVGLAGMVAVRNDASGSTTRPAAEPSQQTMTGATMSAPTTTPSVSTSVLGDAPVMSEPFSPLLVPIGTSDTSSEVIGLDASWVSNARSFVTPEGRVLSVLLRDPLFNSEFPGDMRRVGTTDFTFANKDGRHIYVATGECQSVAVVAFNEDGSSLAGTNGTIEAYPRDAPWSIEALTVMANITVDSSDDWAVRPAKEGWAEIEGGFSELLYDTSFTLPNSAGVPSVSARLRQSEAPLGHLIAVSQEAFVSAAPATVEGLPSNVDGDRAWVLTDGAGRWYVGWNTEAGSALLSVEAPAAPNWSEIGLESLQVGHPQFWEDALFAAGGGAPSSPDVTTAAAAQEEGVVPTTVLVPSPAESVRCGPLEGG